MNIQKLNIQQLNIQQLNIQRLRFYTWIIFGTVLIITGCAKEPGQLGAAEQVDSFMHIHGLAYEPEAPYDLFLATHHGLIRIREDGSWQATSTEEHRHDLMGFQIKDDQTFVSSGHPAEASPLEDPLGVVISDDQGTTWEPIALHGEVDFHHLHIHAGNNDVWYGINTYGPEAGLYVSDDGGHHWKSIDSQGLPEDLNEVTVMVVHPEYPQILLVGTQRGIMLSEDGGSKWSFSSTAETITGAGIQSSDVLVAYLIGEKQGLFRSVDFGQSWEPVGFELENGDAVTFVALHPANQDIMTVGTIRENVWQSFDGGQTWRLIAEEGVKLWTG